MKRIFTWPMTDENSLRPWWQMVWATLMAPLWLTFHALAAVFFGLMRMSWQEAREWFHGAL